MWSFAPPEENAENEIYRYGSPASLPETSIGGQHDTEAADTDADADDDMVGNDLHRDVDVIMGDLYDSQSSAHTALPGATDADVERVTADWAQREKERGL